MSQNKMIINQLKGIYHNKSGEYLNSNSILKSININNNTVSLTFYEAPGSQEIKNLEDKIEEEIFKLDWVKELEINLAIKSSSKANKEEGLKNVSNIIAISSCKGGVGKSTMAINVATSLALNGAQVGIFDADIYGPSLPALLKPQQISSSIDENYIPPFINNNIKLMSYGYIQDQVNQPAILRGPIASNLIKQMIFKTDWGYLDYLIIDCPPGTGDILLSITQEIQLTGAIIITTPHELSYIDVEKGIEMFQKVNVPIHGIIENMSYFKCSPCAEKFHIFGKGRLQKTATKHQIKNWYEIPILAELSNYNDKNTPFLYNTNNSEIKDLFKRIANDTAWEIIQSEKQPVITTEYNNESSIITIKSENKTKTFSYKELRLSCKCALCVDEFTGEQKFKESDMDENISIHKVFNVGHYAIGVEWNEHGGIHKSMYQNSFLI